MSDGVSSSVSRPVQTTEHHLAKSALKPRTPAGAVKPEEVGGKQIPKQTSDDTMLPGLEKLVTIRQNIDRNIKEIHTADDTLQGLSSRIDGLSKKTQKGEITELKAQQEKEMQKIETAKITVQTLKSMEETQLREQASQLEVTAIVVALDPKTLAQTNKELTNVEKQIKNCEEQENKVQGKIDKLLKSLSTDDRKQLDAKVGTDKSTFLKQKGFSDKQLDEYKALRDDKKQLNEKKQFLQRQKSDLEKQIKLADPKRGEILKREIVSAFASFEIADKSSRSQELTQAINKNLTDASLGNVASDIFRDAPKVSIVRDGKQQKSAATSAEEMPDNQAHMKEILIN